MSTKAPRETASATYLLSILAATAALALCGCHSSSTAPAPGPEEVPEDFTLAGLVADGPVIGGTVYVFAAEQLIAALEAADGAEDRNAALASAEHVAILGRAAADEDEYELDAPADLAEEAVFLVFDNTDAEDEDFGDTPPNLEAVVVLGTAGSARTVNLTPHTTAIARLVRAELDPEGDGTPIDAAAIGAAIQAARMNVLDALGRNRDGDALFPGGEDPTDTEDGDLLHAASSSLGFDLRSIAALEGISLDEVLEALALDAGDGSIDGAIPANLQPDGELEALAKSIAAFRAREDDEDFAMSAVGPCSSSAVSLRRACALGAIDDLFEGRAFCADISDDELRAECLAELDEQQDEAAEECDDVLDARLEICESLDDRAHEPMFGPAFAARFVDPREIGGAVEPNPYFPLVSGNEWVYEKTFEDDDGETVTETVTVTVTDALKVVDGVPCLVVNDRVEATDGSVEDTDDWLAQDTDGNVWYCGEISSDFETFEGDDPVEPELVATDGSWKAGRGGAKAGVLMPAEPEVGELIRQELLYGEAEDVIEIESVTATEAAPGGACDGDCLKTLDCTPLARAAEETKYYAPGIGFIVEVDLETGDRLELMEFNPAP